MIELILNLHGPNGCQYLGSAVIQATGQNKGDTGDYQIAISKRGQPEQVWLKASITGFHRKKFGPWDLAALALGSCLYPRLTQQQPTTPEDDK